MTFNKIIMLGYLTRDPELRYTPKGTAIAMFGIALNRKWKGEDGQEHEEVTFVDCNAFGRTAETMGQYLKKGHPIHIEGRLKQDIWEDKQTHQTKSKLKVIVETFQFIPTGDRDRQPEESRPPQRQRAAAPSTPTADDSMPPEDENDVPF